MGSIFRVAGFIAMTIVGILGLKKDGVLSKGDVSGFLDLFKK
jgi:hypothetical protein